MLAIAREDFLKISLLLTKSGRVFFVILQIYRNIQKAKKTLFSKKVEKTAKKAFLGAKTCIFQKKVVTLQKISIRGANCALENRQQIGRY